MIRRRASPAIIRTARAGTLDPADVIFETNFGNDAGWTFGPGTAATSLIDTPNGWTAVKTGSVNQAWEIQNGYGKDGSPGLSVLYGAEQNVGLYLAKHLTGDVDIGYRDFYFQYQIRYDPTFLWSNYATTPGLVWKLWRIWHNTSTDASSPDCWSENGPPLKPSNCRDPADTRYIVHNIKGSDVPNEPLRFNFTCNAEDDDSDSASSARKSISYDFEADSGSATLEVVVPEWELQSTGGNRGRFVGYTSDVDPGTQGWHTIQYHIRYNSTAANTTQDGIIEFWVDGQHFTTNHAACNTEQHNVTGWSGGLCTHGEEAPGGANFFLLCENAQHVMQDWSAHRAHYVRYNQVVFAKGRIPDDYAAAAA